MPGRTSHKPWQPKGAKPKAPAKPVGEAEEEDEGECAAGYTREELEDMKVAELRDVMRDLSVEGKAKTKVAIIDLILKAQG